MTQEQKTDKISTYKWLYFVFIINMMIVGYATTNIINFAIEDKFMQPIVYGISDIWGPEFAKSAAWLIIGSFTVLAFAFFQKRLAIQNTELYNVSFRNKLLNLSFAIGLFTALSYILVTLYSYFAGESDSVGLYRVLSTIIMISIGLTFLLFEKFLSPKFHLSKYLYVFSIFLLICLIIGLSFTFQYASPSKMRQIKNDLRKIDAIESMAYLIKDSFIMNGSLPNDKVSILQENNNSNKNEFYNEIYYELLSNSKFQLCAQFDTDYTDARRISYYKNKFYKAGKHCLIFYVERNSSGGEVNVVNNHNIKIILR